MTSAPARAASVTGTVFAVDSQHITWRTPDSEGAE
jgi:hypothetical protein